jgi:hypothetical protein
VAFLAVKRANYSPSWFALEHRSEYRSMTRSQISSAALEEEIHRLRLRMEQMVSEGQEMVSEDVIELSSQLDRKIVEYMNLMKKVGG